MLEIFRAVTKGGLRTSEFWLSLAAILLPYADNAAQHTPGTAGLIASAAVAAGYAVSRGYVKGKAATAASDSAAAESAAEIVGSQTAVVARP